MKNLGFICVILVFLCKLLVYLTIMLKDIILSTVTTAKNLLTNQINIAELYIDVSDLSIYEIILMSVYISLTPGTFTIRACEKYILVHVLTKDNQTESALIDLRDKTKSLFKALVNS